MTARDRLDTLFDEATFQEMGGPCAPFGPPIRHGDQSSSRRRRSCRHRLCRRTDGLGLRPGFHRARRLARKDARQEDRDDDGGGGEIRLAGRRIQGFRRRPHSGGRGRALGLWLRVLPECAAVRRGAADRRGLWPLRGRRLLFAGAHGLRHHDPEQRLYVHHRAGGHQGGDRQDGDAGGSRRRRHACLGFRQRAFSRAGRRRSHSHRAQAAFLPAGQ